MPDVYRSDFIQEYHPSDPLMSLSVSAYSNDQFADRTRRSKRNTPGEWSSAPTAGQTAASSSGAGSKSMGLARLDSQFVSANTNSGGWNSIGETSAALTGHPHPNFAPLVTKATGNSYYALPPTGINHSPVQRLFIDLTANDPPAPPTNRPPPLPGTPGSGYESDRDTYGPPPPPPRTNGGSKALRDDEGIVPKRIKDEPIDLSAFLSAAFLPPKPVSDGAGEPSALLSSSRRRGSNGVLSSPHCTYHSP